MTNRSAALPGRSIVAVACVALTAALAALYVARADSSSTTLRATFSDVSPLVAGNFVKVDGVQVGTISSIELRNGMADVVLELDPAALPIHQDASLTIRTKSLLGERYIDLDRGTDSQPVMDLPGRIPSSRTSKSTDVQDVLNTLDDPTSTAAAALLVTLGEGTAGRGRDIDTALKAVAPVFDGATKLSEILDAQNAALLDLLDTVTPIAQAVATDDGQQAERLVDSAENALAALAEERAALDESLERLPGTLKTARTSLKELSELSTETTSTLKALRPVTDELPEVTDELREFSESADPALRSLGPVLDRAQALIDEARPLVRDLQPGMRGLRTVSAGARPVVEELEPRLEVVLDFAKWWALATSDGDGIGQYFKGVVPTTPQSLLNAPGIHLPTGVASATNSKATPDSAGAIGGVDSADALLKDATSGLTSGITKSVTPKTSTNPVESVTERDNDSATGLDQKQEKNLLQQILGGGR